MAIIVPRVIAHSLAMCYLRIYERTTDPAIRRDLVGIIRFFARDQTVHSMQLFHRFLTGMLIPSVLHIQRQEPMLFALTCFALRFFVVFVMEQQSELDHMILE